MICTNESTSLAWDVMRRAAIGSVFQGRHLCICLMIDNGWRRMESFLEFALSFTGFWSNSYLVDCSSLLTSFSSFNSLVLFKSHSNTLSSADVSSPTTYISDNKHCCQSKYVFVNCNDTFRSTEAHLLFHMQDCYTRGHMKITSETWNKRSKSLYNPVYLVTIDPWL